ncbi:adenylyl cyclase [Deinococcus sp.]|uniref:adenylyl cyclase n=1 Tax=Deinococcus sp. TaxID=47478 RepID=UPI0025CD550B|nr:adenylyl cyclase [Deinococcus sp.]
MNKTQTGTTFTPGSRRPFGGPRQAVNLAVNLALLTGLVAVLAACGQQSTPGVSAPASDQGALEAQGLNDRRPRPLDLGPNVRVFDPSMPVADIQAAVDAIYAQQVDSEMGTGRYSLLFKPGSYGTAAAPLMIRVGYYTEVAGLGALPTDVTINGHVDVFNRCLDGGGTSNCLALDNFWRSASNLSVNLTNPAGYDGCRGSGNFWAVSQAAPLRRFNMLGGNLSLMDYCTVGPQYASGGFIADSQAATIINGSQQQFLVRNSKVSNWTNGVWNQVFAGVEGAPATSFGVAGAQPYTTLATTPASREKPYLYLDAAGKYRVFVPDARTDSAGLSWAAGQGAGKSLSIDEFFVARPSDSVGTINNALARGLNLIFTPGVYDIGKTLKVRRADTVVLGLGIATLTAQNGAVPMTVGNVPGVSISGLMFDAGERNSPALLQIGKRRSHQGYQGDDDNDDDNDGSGSRRASSASNPTVLSDVFFRIGGPHVGKATNSLIVNTDNTILDHIWAWRADHGNPGSFGWTVNTADTGLIVNADNVTATGLFVEHYQKNEVIWNGENGKTIMFQNELPYDAPNQAAWRPIGPVLGYAGYKVGDQVKAHQGWGMGSYIFTNVDPTIHATHGFEVPVTPGVKLRSLLTVQLGAGTLDHVVNDTGAAVTGAAIGVPSTVVSFP